MPMRGLELAPSPSQLLDAIFRRDDAAIHAGVDEARAKALIYPKASGEMRRLNDNGAAPLKTAGPLTNEELTR